MWVCTCPSKCLCKNNMKPLLPSNTTGILLSTFSLYWLPIRTRTPFYQILVSCLGSDIGYFLHSPTSDEMANRIYLSSLAFVPAPMRVAPIRGLCQRKSAWDWPGIPLEGETFTKGSPESCWLSVACGAEVCEANVSPKTCRALLLDLGPPGRGARDHGCTNMGYIIQVCKV